jgi:hypothetical protein
MQTDLVYSDLKQPEELSKQVIDLTKVSIPEKNENITT